MQKTLCKYTVTVQRKDQIMTKIVNEDSFTIGRSVDCAISLTEDSISRVHLSVYRKQQQIWIEDKGSSNGTFVNNIKIAPNTLVSILPDDKIRIGKSDYIIAVTLELKEQEASEDANNKTPDFAVPQLVSEKIVERRPEKSHFNIQIEKKVAEEKAAEKVQNSVLEKKSVELVLPKTNAKSNQTQAQRPVGRGDLATGPAGHENSPQFEGEQILHEAHKRAAQIIYEGEIQAEKRVQTIYVQARERQADADVYYQKKISAAHKEADAVLMSFQDQGQELIARARHMAQELRDEVELFVENMRDKTRKEVDHVISEARQEAEIVRKEAFEKAISKAEIEASDIVASAKAESQDLLGFAKMQSEEMLEKARLDIQTELKDLREQIEVKQKSVTLLKKEEEELQIKALGEKEEHEIRISDLVAKFNALSDEVLAAKKDLASIRVQEANSHSALENQEQKNKELKSQNQNLLNEKSSLESKLKELQAQVGHFSLEIQSADEKKKQIEAELSQQKAQLRERLERERQQILKDSEERLNESQLEMGKRLQKLERELFEEIVSRRDKIVKEVVVVVETRIAKVLEPSKWDQVSSQIFEGVQDVIEGKAISFSDPTTGVPKQSVSLQRKKKKENIRWMSVGLVCGLIAAVGGSRMYAVMTQDKNPMRTIAAEETRRRQEDLDKRKFAPVQVAELKDTYTDAVIYTKGFVDGFQDAEFQKKLYKSASAYLLKTWRVDEDKSIQVISVSSALVKELGEKRLAIHPDFVKDGILKMRELEKQTLERMKMLLGSEVRLESYRRFEKKFYEQESQLRKAASQN